MSPLDEPATTQNLHLADLKRLSPAVLLEMAEELEIENASSMRKGEMMFSILKERAEEGWEVSGDGVLEVLQDGFGFLRSTEANYLSGPDDIYVSPEMIRQYALRTGDTVDGVIAAPGENERYFSMTSVTQINYDDPQRARHKVHFDNLTPLYPDERLHMETDDPTAKDRSARIIDIVSPLGKGQRALIVAPPRTGKTILLQHISHGIATNYPDVKLIVLLIDERPEEVTDMKRAVIGEVVASSLDREIESHVRLSQLVVERCKRLAEMGKDVVMLMDSITRLARAFNKWVGNTGRTMSGGVDIKAMDIPKKLFATARLFEEGGSLTIVGTALVDTGSRMDELIFQEFKGTGNMELVLDRKLSDRRIWPAIDITQSGTRREEKLLPPDWLHAITMLRRTLSSMHHVDAMEQLTAKLGKFNANEEFIKLISGSA